MCAQINVKGKGKALPGPKDLVAFPGAYTPETPGIIFNIYSGKQYLSFAIAGRTDWGFFAGGNEVR